MNRGFSLVELSIVLVILGLLTGGILAGQSLIRAAELRSVSTEFNRYVAATQTFRDKYFALPGDMNNATKFWGDQATGTGACASAATPDGTPGTCDGNGNGNIQEGTNEGFRYWQQLALAGLVEGTFSGITGVASANDAVIGTNVPPSKLSSAGWTVSNWWGPIAGDAAYWYAGDYGNFFVFGTKWPTGFTNGPAIKPEEAWNIDTKMDDGLPGRGKVMPVNHGTCTLSTSQTDYTSGYDLALSGNQCGLVFMQLF